MTLIDDIAIVLIGFSIGAALVLLAALFAVYRATEQGWLGRLAGVALMLGMTILQMLHADFLIYGGPLFHSKVYSAVLFAVAPAFYLFSRTALEPQDKSQAWRLFAFAPIVLVFFLDNSLAIPLAFLIGTGYAACLSLLVYRLRAQRKRFRLELMAFASFAVVALMILVLGLIAPLVGPRVFVLGYAILTGLGFWLALFALLRFPDLVANTTEAVRTTYAASTLKSIDRAGAIAGLKRLMDVDKIYVDENLSLARLAQPLELSPHQLSELINTHFGIGFSRYVREHRVAAAKRMLIDEPDASVLSIGLSVGFISQSNFYAAFREIAGDVPGKFRKNKPGANSG